MAVLSGPFQRIIDSDGEPVTSPFLRVYDVGTTDLADVYSDPELDTALPNPVPGNSAGWFPAMYAAPDVLFDIQALENDETTEIPDQQWLSWPAVGSGSGEFERALTGARVKIAGGDVDGTPGVTFQAGDPLGDDIGGRWKFTGWDETQADRGILDAAEISATGTFEVEPAKGLKEAGKRLSEVLYTDATTFTTASTVDIALPNTPAGTRGWEIDIWDLVFSTGSFVAVRLAYDGVPTFKTGGTDYAFSGTFNNAGTIDDFSDDAEAYIRAMWTGQADANWPATGMIRIVTRDSGNGNTVLSGRFDGYKNDFGSGVFMPGVDSFCGVGKGNYGRATHVRLYPGGGGTMTGKYNLRTLRGYGE